MRIYNEDHDKTIKGITLLLKKEEAEHLRDSLQNLLESDDADNHAHINDFSYEHEITIAIYDEKNLGMLHERIKRVILEDN